MSKEYVLRQLQSYRDHKGKRLADHSKNLEACLDRGNYEQAQVHLKKSNELSEVIFAIEHCITIVMANRNGDEESAFQKRWNKMSEEEKFSYQYPDFEG